MDVYRKLCETMARRGGMYPGMDIPEFYDLAHELFTPEEAALSNVMPRGLNTARVIAESAGRDEAAVSDLLEQMADKGLCMTLRRRDMLYYAGPPFVPGIIEYQFLRGTTTPRDRKLAQLIRAYKKAVDERLKPKQSDFPVMRVIAVNRTIQAPTQIHTYDQVKSYIESAEPLAVSHCYCRHEARLLDDGSHCGRPDEVCLHLGFGAQFVLDRKMGREISKAEAMEILERSEAAGLVHCTNNRQEIDFLCNCCACHCVILKKALAHPLPGLALNSGFKPQWREDLCTNCETCIERCPMAALSLKQADFPQVDLNRCIGCGVCATGCPAEAIEMVSRTGIPEPPLTRKALKEAIKAGLPV